MEEKLGSKDMLLDITSMRSRAIALLDQGKEYNTLLKAITAKDYFYDDSINKFPQIKDLAQQTGLKYDQVRKQLRQIYEDLKYDFEKPVPFNFKRVEYSFYLKGLRTSTTFVTDYLPVVPRIGEAVNVPFFKALVGTDYFYVKDVRHTFHDNLQLVDIWLYHGSYNLYWHFRKDQAEEEGEIGLLDSLKLDEYSLKRKLRIGRYRD